MNEKKNLSLLVLKVLKLFSSPDTPLSVSDICRILKQEYARECDKRTLRSALNSISECDFPVKVKKGENSKDGWYIESDFDEKDVRAVFTALSTSVYIDESTEKRLKEKLSRLFKYDKTVFYKTRRASIESLKIIRALEATEKAIREHRFISFSIALFTANGKSRFERIGDYVKIYLVRPVEVICAYGTLFLFCELGNTRMYRFFPLEKMYDVRAESIDLCPSEQISAPLPDNYLEAKTLIFSEKQRAVVRIQSRYLSEFTDNLGTGYEILYTSNDKCEIAVTTDLRALKRLILSFGSYVEAISPTKLRRSIAQELRANIAVYPEFRHLRGNI